MTNETDPLVEKIYKLFPRTAKLCKGALEDPSTETSDRVAAFIVSALMIDLAHNQMDADINKMVSEEKLKDAVEKAIIFPY